MKVYGPEGNFKREFGEHRLSTPLAFAAAGELQAIPEVQVRVTLVGPN